MVLLYVVLIAIIVIIVLYLLAIRPRTSRQGQWASFDEAYYAHRGLHDNESQAPENSMAAFRKAVKAGYGIELDVQLTKDKVPVVFHDFTLKRACGRPGKVSEYTYEELQQFPLFHSGERIPRFEEVLKLVDKKVPIIVEIKTESTDCTVCAYADNLLRDYKGQYCIESFNPLALIWYRKHHNDVLRGQLSEAFIKEGEYKGLLYWILQNLLLNWITQPDFIAYNHKYADNLSRRLCRRLYGVMSAGWTIKSQEELESAKKEYDVYIFDSFIPDRQI